jgi:hypothetical protein
MKYLIPLLSIILKHFFHFIFRITILIEIEIVGPILIGSQILKNVFFEVIYGAISNLNLLIKIRLI